MGDTKTGLQLRSLITKSGELEISLLSVPTPEPGPDDIVVRIEASPINPSDLGLLLGPADISAAKADGGVLSAPVPGQFLIGFPFVTAAIVTLDANRQAYLRSTLPDTTPSGLSLFFQFASFDPGSPKGGVALSNGLEVIFP